MAQTSGGAKIASVEKADFSQEMNSSFKQYGGYVNLNRALPDVRDGMKPVHRRVLWALYSDRILPGKKQKAANCVGSVMKFHPHGDSAIYGTMVNMAHVPSEGDPYRNPMPLIDGQGNWGDLIEEAAAMRYPECSLHSNALPMLGDAPDIIDGSAEVKENAVDMIPNHDGRLTEPSVLPALWPSFLINTNEGMGVGIRTKTASHNLTEVMNLAAYMVDTPNPRMAKVRELMPGPDMSCEADIFDSDNEDWNIESYYKMGMGSFTMRSKTTIEEYKISARKSGKQIVVDSLPYKVAPEEVVSGVGDMVYNEMLPPDVTVENRSDANGIRIVIDVKENDADDILQRLLYHGNRTEMQKQFVVEANAVVDGRARTVGILEALSIWIDHRRTCIRRRTKFRLAKAQARMEIVMGFIQAIPIADKIVDMIRGCDSRKEAELKLQEKQWGFTANQASAILDMTLSQLTKLSVDRYLDEKNDLQSKIDDYNDLLNNPRSLDNRLKKEIRAVRDEYGYGRRCEIKEGSARVAAPDTPAVVIPPKNGYIVRTANNWVRWATRSNVNKIHGTSYVTDLIPITDHNMVDAISSFGWHYRIAADSLPEKLTKAEALYQNVEPGESMVMVGSGSIYDSPDIVIVAESDDGRPMLKRLDFEDWTNIREGGKPKKALVQDDYTVTQAFFLPQGQDIGIITGYGAMLKIDSDDIGAKGRAARGVPAVNLAMEDDYVAWAGPIANDETIVYWTSAGKVGWFKSSEVDYVRRNTLGKAITRSQNLIRGVRVSRDNPDKLVYFDGENLNEVALTDQTTGPNLSDRQLKIEDTGLIKATAIWLDRSEEA